MKYAEKYSLRTMVLTAVFTALTCCLTMFPQIPIPAANGYLHFGDSVIYLGAAFLPAPYALIAGALGGALADIFSGYAIWAIPTAIIKALISLPISSKETKIASGKNIAMLFLSGIISISGYFIAGAILYQNFVSAVAGLPSSFIQAAGSAIIFAAVGFILDRSNFKTHMLKLM